MIYIVRRRLLTMSIDTYIVSADSEAQAIQKVKDHIGPTPQLVQRVPMMPVNDVVAFHPGFYAEEYRGQTMRMV